MRVASAGLVYWVARFFLLGTKARILGLTLSLPERERDERALCMGNAGEFVELAWNVYGEEELR